MRFFTVEEAEDLLPTLRPMLEKIKSHYAKVSALRDAAKDAACETGGGGMAGGTIYFKSLFEVGRLTNEIDELGVQMKDYTRGLIDFPSMREGQTVLLCWQLGEPERIEWWHEIETGFAGRKPL